MKDWVWLDRGVVLSLQMELIEAHGGEPGLRDSDALDAALGAAPALASRGGALGAEADVAALAARYGHSLSTTKPFRDGNRRIALICTELFLRLNGWRLMASEADWLLTQLDLSIGAMDAEAFALWLREHLEPEHR